MLFNPRSDECTTFVNVRVLRFYENAVEINIADKNGEKKLFTNTKPLALYFNTETHEILNTLQKVSLASEKLKAKYRLGELLEVSDIEKRLKDWIKN